jgi:hypothetical protein
MARIRTIKPEFPQSESMGRVSREARLLFVLLWTLCDDAGRTRAASRMLASLLFPYDDDAPALIDGWLAELEREGCLWFYEAGGSRYLQIANWSNHQKIDKPSGAKFPEPRESSRGLARIREHSSEDRDHDLDHDLDQNHDQPPRMLPPIAERIATAVPRATRKSPATDDQLRAVLAAWNRGSGQRLTWGARQMLPTEQIARHGPDLPDIERAAAAYVASLSRGFPPSFPRFAEQFDRWISEADRPPEPILSDVTENNLAAARAALKRLEANG